MGTHYDNTPGYQRNLKPASNTYDKYRNQNEEPNYGYRPTEKKKKDQSNRSLDDLMEKNNTLAAENAELYQMLEERGRIVTAL